MVIAERHQDRYRTFFTADETLSSYLASLLNLSPHDCLLEPAAGDGHLLAAVLGVQPKVSVTAYELHPEHAGNLRKKFGALGNVQIVERDTIGCPDLDLRESFGPKFTKILANPPYGGWQAYERRLALKKRYPGFYVKETYTLFLLRCLRLLAAQGQLVFIIPDTFLYLHLHAALRRLILSEYTIDRIDWFRSSLFPGISFGYAGLCIISIRAQQPTSTHRVLLRQVDSLAQLQIPVHLQTDSRSLLQNDLLHNHSQAIPLSSDQTTLNITADANVCLMGELADCVTGFYSGNDPQFLRRGATQVKGAGKYAVVDANLIEWNPSTLQNPLHGIAGPRPFVPLLKGGGYTFWKPTQWYVDWSEVAVAHYRTDKRARFQNSSYYFKRGIGFPMVTSTRPTASILEESLFDQSIVGIFPKSSVSLEFLLAYCNSPVFWECLKTINPSANNSARYILRTPVILPSPETVERISQQTRELLLELRSTSYSARTLEQEIIRTITAYVNKKASDQGLPLARAVP